MIVIKKTVIINDTSYKAVIINYTNNQTGIISDTSLKNINNIRM